MRLWSLPSVRVVVALGAHPYAGINRIRFDGRRRKWSPSQPGSPRPPRRCYAVVNTTLTDAAARCQAPPIGRRSTAAWPGTAREGRVPCFGKQPHNSRACGAFYVTPGGDSAAGWCYNPARQRRAEGTWPLPYYVLGENAAGDGPPVGDGEWVLVQDEAQAGSARPRRPLRPYVASLCFVLLLQTLNLTFLGPFARQAPVPPKVAAQASSFPYTEVNPYGANTFLSKEVEDWKREKTVAMMADAGLGWMKQQFPWSEIEPKPGRFWDDKFNQNSWDKYDRIVSLAEQYGLRVIARIDNTPDWARGPNTSPQTPPADFDRFAEFVAAFIQHYQGRVQYLQIWNEPNLSVEWGGTLDPVAYATMLRKVYVRAKAVDPNVVILSAPLAQTTEQSDRGLDDLLFLQQLYDAGFRDSFDIMMANGYGFNQPPDAPPDPGQLNLRRVELERAVMERNGDAAKPVWLNEYAWNAAPTDIPSQWRQVTEEQQATYTLAGIRYMRDHWPWLGVVNIWYFRQVGDIKPDSAEYYFRMVDPEFTRQTVYRDVARAAILQRLAAPGRYGPLSPALVSRGRWTTLRTATGGLALRSDRPGDELRIHFQGNQLTLDAERSPTGARLWVTLDGGNEGLQNLPQDDRGRRYFDLRAAAAESETVTVILGIDRFGGVREHDVVLKTLPAADGAAGSVTITGVEISYARSSFLFLIVSALAALLAALATIRVLRALARARQARQLA